MSIFVDQLNFQNESKYTVQAHYALHCALHCTLHCALSGFAHCVEVLARKLSSEGNMPSSATLLIAIARDKFKNGWQPEGNIDSIIPPQITSLIHTLSWHCLVTSGKHHSDCSRAVSFLFFFARRRASSLPFLFLQRGSAEGNNRTRVHLWAESNGCQHGGSQQEQGICCFGANQAVGNDQMQYYCILNHGAALQFVWLHATAPVLPYWNIVHAIHMAWLYNSGSVIWTFM